MLSVRKQKAILYDKVAFFVKKHNSVFNGIEVYKSNDTQSQIRDLMGSSWDFEDIQNIVTTINLYSLHYERYDNAKNDVERFVKQIKSLDSKNIAKSFQILGETNNNIEKLTQTIQSLAEKVSELKITY